MLVIHEDVSPAQRRLLDVNDLSERWGVSVATLYRKRSNGEDMPTAVKIGSQVRWREEVVAAWEEAHELEEAG
jgi:prophage regulatory protein